MDRMHSIRIPIHGFVEFSDWERDIINHPVFQRLRRIRQLAFSEHIYPGSVHSRFEHSIGVMHVATRLFNGIRSRYSSVLQNRLGVKGVSLERAKTLVRLAALLHDVGHAPFSHTSEDLMPSGYEHEDYSVQLITHEMRDVIDNHDFNRRELQITGQEIASFYMGDPDVPEEHLFWKELVSGQLDADRMDYLLRDSYHCGVEYGHFDLDRIVDTISIVENESPDSAGGLRLGLTAGGSHAADGLIMARYFMFQQVYFHEVRLAYDHHASKLVQSYLDENGNGELPNPAVDCGRHEYLNLDDWTLLGYAHLNRSNEHSCSLLTHQHDRCVARTSEQPNMNELRKFGQLAQKMSERIPACWVADARKAWYKLDDTDIRIAKHSTGSELAMKSDPLSQVSAIVGHVRGSNKRLLFVPFDRVEEAKSLMEEDSNE